VVVVSALEDLIAPLRAEPGASALLCDIDGTLAPIVEEPGGAAAPAETRDAVRVLARQYLLVACVSGRRALDARRIVGVDEIAYAGNHGFELLTPGGELAVMDPALGRRADLPRRLIDALDASALAASGLRIEDKGPIQALHWRLASDPEGALAEARAIAARAQAAGLVPRWGRRVLEIRPVAGIDKGSAATRLIRDGGAAMALFGGDDATDLDAFRALEWLQRAGRLRAAVRVGVSSDEEPEGLREATDAVVDGTEGFLAVLRALDTGSG
jgi:trehalose 6-phosphate phosphatase